MKWTLLWIATLLAWAIFRGALPLLLLGIGLLIMASPLFGDGK